MMGWFTLTVLIFTVLIGKAEYVEGIIISNHGVAEMHVSETGQNVKAESKVSVIEFGTVPSMMRLNCGGLKIGNFLADQRKYYSKSPSGVARFPNPPVATSTSPYESNSFGRNRGNLTYTLPVKIGSRVRVVAGFAETWKKAEILGTRIMNVVIDGVLVAKDLDVSKSAGGLNIPYYVIREFTATKSYLTVDAVSVKQNAFMSTLSVFAWPQPTPMPPAVLAAIPIPKSKALPHKTKNTITEWII